MRPATRPSLANLLWLPPLLFLALFYFFPLASILQISFARGAGPGQRPSWRPSARPPSGA